MTDHFLIVEPDIAYAAKFPDAEPEFTYAIECSDPAACPGWIECSEDHAGFDRDDVDSPACDEDEFEIHGAHHTWQYGYGWCVDYPGCPVLSHADALDDLPETPGRYELDIDWDYDECCITIVEAAVVR